MRLFFGLDLSPDTKAAISDWRDRYALADGKPVPPANFHITLAFLGEFEERLLEPLCNSVDVYVEGTPVSLQATALDRVGYWQTPGIYWLGSSANQEDMGAIARKLGSIGQRIGARRERRQFVPHVTLYRRCTAPPPNPVSAPLFELRFGEITLFESKQGRRNMFYEPLATWQLKR